jgi:hypothetical protein
MKSDSGWNRLQCRIFAVAVDRAMIDAAIFEILDEIRGEEALADSAFAVEWKGAPTSSFEVGTPTRPQWRPPARHQLIA